ncbi:MAG: amino acid ABC transporter permease [Peptococcaceae bacterium]|jgi:polar amino acid transport system permease protein|nr:amino acid ABC transporter permease [Peptococcaceae bacterium]
MADFWKITFDLLNGFQTTFLIWALTLVFALPLGLVISFGSMSKFTPLRYLVKTFVWIIRGIPLMLQIFIIFYVPGFIFGAPVASRFTSAIIAFTINYACYFSEIYRGGIESISRSQYEAGQVLGMTKPQVFFRVILLQVIKRITAPMSNEVITLVKDTALVRVIMVVEIIKVAEDIATTGLIWPLFYTGLYYLMFVGMLTLLFGYIERRLDYFKA